MNTDDFEAWRPLLTVLRDTAPPGTTRSTYQGTLSAGSFDGEPVDHGGGQHDGHDDARTEAFFAACRQLPRGTSVHLSLEVARTGEAQVEVFRLDGCELEPGSGSPIATVLLDDVLPPPYRREPVDHAVADGPSDPELVATTVRAAVPSAQGVEEDRLGRLEQQHGIRLPDDVRALYLTAAEGELELGRQDDGLDDEDDDELEVEDELPFYGMQILPLDDEAERSTYSVSERKAQWQFSSLTVPEPDPTGRVQLLGGTSPRTWFPIGTDWGGNQYCVDLAPGPNGRRGQVVFVHHEANAGAEYVAESLSELLRQNLDETELDPPEIRRSAYPRDAERLSAAVTPELEVLSIPQVGAHLDVSALRGHAGLWSFQAERGAVADLSVLAELPALEHLSLDPDDWTVLLDQHGLPAGLHAAGFEDAGLDEALPVANRIRGLRGLPPLETVSLAGHVGAPHDSAEPTVTEGEDPAKRRHRWWRRW